MPFAEGDKLCRDKGATMPVIERDPYGEDIAEFMGNYVNGFMGETSIWLGRSIQRIYRDRLKGLYVVGRSLFLLLLSCSCLPVLPGLAWVLLNNICTLFSRSLYKSGINLSLWHFWFQLLDLRTGVNAMGHLAMESLCGLEVTQMKLSISNHGILSL